jgi:hypothetical protein
VNKPSLPPRHRHPPHPRSRNDALGPPLLERAGPPLPQPGCPPYGHCWAGKITDIRLQGPSNGTLSDPRWSGLLNDIPPPSIIEWNSATRVVKIACGKKPTTLMQAWDGLWCRQGDIFGGGLFFKLKFLEEFRLCAVPPLRRAGADCHAGLSPARDRPGANEKARPANRTWLFSGAALIGAGAAYRASGISEPGSRAAFLSIRGGRSGGGGSRGRGRGSRPWS